MLSISALSKTLPGRPGTAPRRLLDGIDFTVAPGELVALIGESGSGKTTLLNLIAGLDRADAGSIRLDTDDITTLDDDALAGLRRRRFGFVFQAFHVLPHLSIAQNVALPLWLNGVAEQEAATRAAAALAGVGLDGRGDGWPRELSGGELQRIAVARALIHGPRLLLADEPTGNLDPDNADRILALLVAAVRGSGAVGLLVTHSRAAAAQADRRLLLRRDGRLEALA